jgi:hypothetical protein
MTARRGTKFENRAKGQIDPWPDRFVSNSLI